MNGFSLLISPELALCGEVSVRNIINIVSRGNHYREQLDSGQGRYRSFTVEMRKLIDINRILSVVTGSSD